MRTSIAAALAESGYTPVHSTDLLGCIADRDLRAVITAVLTADDLEALTALAAACPGVAAVALIEDTTAMAFADALRAGAWAVVSRAAELEDVVATLSTALDGVSPLPVGVARQLALTQAPLAGCDLAAHEVEWIRSLASGVTVAELADRVGYSERAMFRHLHDVYSRVGAKTRVAAIMKLARAGVVSDD